MKTIFSYNKNAYAFSDNQKVLVLKLISFLKKYIPNGNQAYLDDMDLDKIKFTWCTEMTIPFSDQLGGWFIIYPDKIYLAPSTDSTGLYNKAKELVESEKDTQKKQFMETSIIKSYQAQKKCRNSNFTTYKINDKDQTCDLIIFINYLCQSYSDGVSILSTIFHELYHKWQFKASYYLPYIINMIIGLIYGYEKSTKSEWFIQGDVRKYIDRKQLHEGIESFFKVFSKYILVLNNLYKNDKEYYDALTKDITLLTEQQKAIINNCKKYTKQLDKLNSNTSKQYIFVRQIIDFILSV